MTGLLDSVGKGLQEKNKKHAEEQATQKQRQLDTQWTAMQQAVTTLDKLKRKQDGGQQLSPEETQQAQQAAGVYQSAQQEYGKLTKSNKPVNEAFQKVSGFVTKILTSKKNQLGGPQGQQQGQSQPMDEKPPGGGDASGKPPANLMQGNGGLLGTGQVPKVAAGASPSGKLTGPADSPDKALTQGSAPAPPQSQAPQGGQPLAGPPAAKPQASVPQLDPKQSTMLYASPQYQAQQAGEQKLELERVQEEQKEKQKLGFEQQEQDAWLKRGKDLGLKDRDLAEYAGSKGARLPAQGKRTTDKGMVRPGEDPATGKGYEGSWTHIVEPDGSETWAKEAAKQTASGVPRVIGHLSSTDAKTQSNGGKKFQDEAGNDIDVSDLPEQMGLVTVTQGSKTFYVPYTQAQTHFNVGGKVYAVPTLDQINLSKGSGVELGASRTPTSASHEQIAVDSNGNPVKNTLRSTNTPSTPGIAGRSASDSAASNSADQRSSPQSQPKANANAPKASPSGALTPASSDIKGVPLGMYNQSLQRVTPVREAATQLFGDPQQPELKGLQSFANLADNKESRERLGKALRQTFTALDQSTGGAHIAAGAGPVSVSTGGFGAILENYFGVGPKVAEQQAKMMQDTIGSLTPEEREAYDATMSAFGTIVGLRALTKASAAQASVSTIEREMPVIGVNTTNSAQFYDQMQRLAEIVYNGTKGIPEGMWDKGMLDRLKSLPNEMQKLKKGASASPSGKLSAPPDTSKKKVKMLTPQGYYVDVDESEVKGHIGYPDRWRVVE